MVDDVEDLQALVFGKGFIIIIFFRLVALQGVGGSLTNFGRARAHLCATCLQIACAVCSLRSWVTHWYVPQYAAVLRRLYEGTGGAGERECLGKWDQDR